jgi:hypothetical protein
MKAKLLNLVTGAALAIPLLTHISAYAELEDEELKLQDPSTSQSEGSLKRQVERQIKGILRHNPGSHRISSTEVEVGDGVVISVASDLKGCPKYWLCLSQYDNFGGQYINFTKCQDENLGNYSMSDGRRWNDKVSSIRNAQVGVQSRFYNYSGSGDPNNPSNWRFVIALNSGHYLRDLSKDSSADGGNADNKIDIVRVC